MSTLPLGEKVKDWLERWYYRNVNPVLLRNRLDKSRWDGTVPDPQCCEAMASAVAEGDCPVTYEAVFRRWELQLLYHRPHTGWQLEYCPWCGKRLPTDLGSEWARRTDGLGFTDMGHYSETPDLPEEYKTDQWWKNAGLPQDFDPPPYEGIPLEGSET